MSELFVTMTDLGFSGDFIGFNLGYGFGGVLTVLSEIWPIGRSRFLWSVLNLPSPYSFLTLKTSGIFKFGCDMIIYGSSSHLSAILCFPSNATFF